MPHNDLIAFERLEPEGTVSGGTKRPADTWAQAVDFLWKMPLPRVIQVTGGDTFEVFGGTDLSLASAPLTDGDVRLDTFRFRNDKEKPVIGASQAWVDADPTKGYALHPFDCIFVSGFAGYGGRRAGGVNEPLAFARPNATGRRSGDAWHVPALDDCVFRLRVTQDDNEAVPQQVPAGGSGRVDASGSVQVAGAASLTVYRLTGDTVLTEGADTSGWNYMAYGWMIRNAADQKWLVMKSSLSTAGDVVVAGRMRYVGCYRDQRNDRAMEGNMQDLRTDGDQVTGLSRHAALLGKRLFSVQAGNDKWLSQSDDLSRVTRHGPAPRVGNDSCATVDLGRNNAGGALAMAVYENTPEFVAFQQDLIPTMFGWVTHLGCWRDAGHDRNMSIKLGDMRGDRNTVVDRALWYAHAQSSSLKKWNDNGYFFVGIETGNGVYEIYIPSEWENAHEHLWKKNGPMLGCDNYDNNQRPLGSPWGMSVYKVDSNETYHNLVHINPRLAASSAMNF
jgi:hypothetical protein